MKVKKIGSSDVLISKISWFGAAGINSYKLI